MELDPKDVPGYYQWLEDHHNATELIADNRTGYFVKAVYHCPQSMRLTECLDFFALVREEETS